MGHKKWSKGKSFIEKKGLDSYKPSKGGWEGSEGKYKRNQASYIKQHKPQSLIMATIGFPKHLYLYTKCIQWTTYLKTI